MCCPQPALPGVARTRSGPSTDTHHIPLLHAVAALNEVGPGGNMAACCGDVTLRPSKDGVGSGLVPLLPIPTVLQGNNVRISTCPCSSHGKPRASPSPLGRIFSCLFTHNGNQRRNNKKVNVHFAPIRHCTGCCQRTSSGKWDRPRRKARTEKQTRREEKHPMERGTVGLFPASPAFPCSISPVI